MTYFERTILKDEIKLEGSDMRTGNVATDAAKTRDKSSKFAKFMKRFILQPLTSGLAGFTTFFVIIFLTKVAAFVFGIKESLQIETGDIIVSTTGFALIFILKILENANKKKS